jgi:hypothetical protein
VVSVLATGPKVACSNPAKAIKNPQHNFFFGWEVKLEVPCRKILRHVKDILKSHGDR